MKKFFCVTALSDPLNIPQAEHLTPSIHPNDHALKQSTHHIHCITKSEGCSAVLLTEQPVVRFAMMFEESSVTV
jgi:hypothetical protein